MANPFANIPRRPQAATVESVAGTIARSVPTVTHSAVAEAIAGERLRITGIIESAEAKTRPAAALRLALHSGMQVDEARAFLAGLPEEPTAHDRLASLFADAMGDAAPALAVAPGLAAGAVGEGRKAKRLAEIAEATAAHNTAHGYTAGSRLR